MPFTVPGLDPLFALVALAPAVVVDEIGHRAFADDIQSIEVLLEVDVIFIIFFAVPDGSIEFVVPREVGVVVLLHIPMETVEVALHEIIVIPGVK